MPVSFLVLEFCPRPIRLDLKWLAAVWVPVGRDRARPQGVGRGGARGLGVGRGGACAPGVGWSYSRALDCLDESMLMVISSSSLGTLVLVPDTYIIKQFRKGQSYVAGS